MPLSYPSFDALRLADQMVGEIGKRTAAYFEGRIGAAWYWSVPGGVVAVARLDSTVTQERWDVLRAQASTTRAGVFSSADFPFAAYATSATTPPFIHDLQGVAEWSNRLYFQMGQLISDAVRWLALLQAVALAPQINPAASYPTLSSLQRRLVAYAQVELDGRFDVKALHKTFGAEISRAGLSKLARAWGADGLLTEPPRRVTYSLQSLVAHGDVAAGVPTAPQPGEAATAAPDAADPSTPNR